MTNDILKHRHQFILCNVGLQISSKKRGKKGKKERKKNIAGNLVDYMKIPFKDLQDFISKLRLEKKSIQFLEVLGSKILDDVWNGNFFTCLHKFTYPFHQATISLRNHHEGWLENLVKLQEIPSDRFVGYSFVLFIYKFNLLL